MSSLYQIGNMLRECGHPRRVGVGTVLVPCEGGCVRGAEPVGCRPVPRAPAPLRLHSCIAELQGAPAVLQRVVHPDIPSVLAAESLVEVDFGNKRAVSSFGLTCRYPELSAEARQEVQNTLLASEMVDARARRSSVISMSWNVPAVRSTRPFA